MGHEARGLDLVRKAMDSPQAGSGISEERLQQEVQRLQARLARVRARGGAYARVDLSDGVRRLLGRLEAGAALSSYVH